MFITYKPTDPQ